MIELDLIFGGDGDVGQETYVTGGCVGDSFRHPTAIWISSLSFGAHPVVGISGNIRLGLEGEG